MTLDPSRHSLVLDIGKTNVKLHLLNHHFESLDSQQMHNSPLLKGLYPHANVAGIWQWLITAIKTWSAEYSIVAISITTHGATAALIDRSADGDGLVLPVLDYEFSSVEECFADYERLRPEFTQTYSPALPGGLNLGRQLYWQQKMFPTEFATASDVLMYPQYWAWRMSGCCVSEVTSLGCHTDLWSPAANDYSSLPKAMGWCQLFPIKVPAWTQIGLAKPDFCAATGIDQGCAIYAGIHDSNASFLRYRRAKGAQPFTVISTGTWTIAMASGVPLNSLEASRDMLANVDVYGHPVACARFMGGREFEVVCRLAGGCVDDLFGEVELQCLLDERVMVLPEFSGGSGPFGGNDGCLSKSVPVGAASALASLYCALVMDYQLDLLASQGDVYIEGAFLKNPLLCAVLAQLRSNNRVWLSKDSTGTVQGAAQLMNWDGLEGKVDLSAAEMINLRGLDLYRNAWRNCLV